VLRSWFHSYLSGRQQCVVLDGCASPLAEVTSGVSQYSILGPLLFCLCVDSLANVSISNTSVLSMYADYIVIYKPIFSALDVGLIMFIFMG